MAYSSGFSPHPRISYANASPTGAASEAEYLEIGLSEVCDPARVQAALDAALPPGLDIVTCVPAQPGALAELLTGSSWTVGLTSPDRAVVDAAVSALLAQDSVLVARMTKNGLREFDARQAVVALTSVDTGLEMVLAHQVPLVRPDDVLSALNVVDERFVLAEAPVLTRLAQGILDPETAAIAEPLGEG